MAEPRDRFRHTSRHPLPASPPHVWVEMGRFDGYPRWSRWFAALDADGEGLVTGRRVQARVDPPGPLRAEFTIEITDTDPPHALTARIAGDLDGHGDVRIEPDGEGSLAVVHWEVTVVDPWLRPLSLAMRPFVTWLQLGLAVRVAAGFRRHLDEADQP